MGFLVISIVVLAGLGTTLAGLVILIFGIVDLVRAGAGGPRDCPRCGYDLGEAPPLPCPECGDISTVEQRQLWAREGGSHVQSAGKRLGWGFVCLIVGATLSIFVASVLASL